MIRHKRRVTRNRGGEGHEDRWDMYRSLRDDLRKKIRAAKARSWGELFSLDKDPWERPYKMVLGKLKQVASPMTETLDPLFIQQVIDLFPEMEDGLNNPIPERETGWDEEDMCVTRGELKDAIRRIRSGKAASQRRDGIR